MLKKEKYIEQTLSIKQFTYLLSGYLSYEKIVSVDPLDADSLMVQMSAEDTYNYEKHYHPLFLVLHQSARSDHKSFATIESSLNFYPKGVQCVLRLYKVKNILDWMIKNIDLDDIKRLLPEWVHSYFESHHEPTLLMKDNSSIKVDELSQIMQFMIECQQEATYQHSHITNKNEQLSKFKKDTVPKIVELSKQKKLTHIKNLKPYDGLTKTQVEYIFDFIQKNKLWLSPLYPTYIKGWLK